MRLRIGNLTLSTGPERPPSLSEIGSTGTYVFNGVIGETGEYLMEFRPGPEQRKIIEKMRRSDGQVKAGLLALTLPLVSAHWDVEPASTDPYDVEVADFVRENMFDDMTSTWDDTVRHALLELPFGFSVLEKVWRLDSNMQYRWRKLAPRLPQTIMKWYVDDGGGLKSIEQWTWKQEKYEQLTIPVEKILVFTHEREGSNFEGVSALRAAYKHWYYKNTLYAIDGMAAERHGLGVAHFTFPKTSTDEQRKKIEAMGERLHAHERAYVALPEGFDFDLKGVAGQLHDIKGSIEHHDQQIVRSILAQFIGMGSSGVGSYALSEDQSSFFLMALRATGKGVCDTFNRHAIRQLVDYNFEVTKYPRLVVSELGYVDVGKLANSLASLGAGAFVTPDEGIEAEVRRLMHLPPAKARGTLPAPQPKPAEDKTLRLYDPSQERDEEGKWTDEGGSSGAVTSDEPLEGKSERVERARRSYKPATKQAQAVANRREQDMAKAIGGKRTADNAPFDVIVGQHAIEVKTIVSGENPKITMHPESLDRKNREAKNLKLTPHTVVFHEKTGKIYYRAGLGSFRLSSMTEYASLAEVKAVLR